MYGVHHLKNLILKVTIMQCAQYMYIIIHTTIEYHAASWTLEDLT